MFLFFTNKTSEIHDDDKFPPLFPNYLRKDYKYLRNRNSCRKQKKNKKIFSIYKQMLFDNKKPPLLIISNSKLISAK